MLADSETNAESWITLPSFLTKETSQDPTFGDKKVGSSSKQSTPSQTRRSDATSSSADSTADKSRDFWAELRHKFTSIPDLGEKIGDAILPSWAKVLPGFIKKLQAELSMSPGSLADEIWTEANDPEANPEIMWDAKVRVSESLCDEEAAFLRRRKLHVRRALAKYLDVPVSDIHPDDVPTIAICGSGGGLRAMVAGTSSLLSAAQAGLFDCATYTAGVSGSCWMQTIFYSSIGQQDHARILEHLKHRIGIHIAFPPTALGLLSSAPTNKYLLSGVVERLRGTPQAEFGLVDVYGLLLAARLMVPKGDLAIDYNDLKVSSQAKYLERGTYPLPIYTAVRHEIPKEVMEESSAEEVKAKARREAWFQWFEWTPYEFFCEELGAGIPTWALGRSFDRGQTTWRTNDLALPEVRMPLLLGIWGSAFCATLSHYYKELRPIVKGLAGFGGIDELIADKDQDLVRLHPIDPASLPNFARNMKDKLPSTCPESIHSAEHLKLMDAGMSNNLPIYPFLRPGREVDIIVAFDASADVRKDNWLKVTDGYVRQRGIRGWPVGSGWPPVTESSVDAAHDLERASAKSAEDAASKVEDARANSDAKKEGQGLGYCTVWVGSKEERTEEQEPPTSKMVEDDLELMHPNAGVTVVYFPLMSNESVPGVDPQTSDYLSTWNFVYTPEEIESVVDLARENFTAGSEQMKRTVKAVWQRKREERLRREQANGELRFSSQLQKADRKRRYGDQGDHFS